MEIEGFWIIQIKVRPQTLGNDLGKNRITLWGKMMEVIAIISV